MGKFIYALVSHLAGMRRVYLYSDSTQDLDNQNSGVGIQDNNESSGKDSSW